MFSGRTDTASARGLLRLGSRSVGAVLIFSPLLGSRSVGAEPRYCILLNVVQLLGMPTGLNGHLEEEQ